MKLYDKRLSEGHRQVIGYQCNACRIIKSGEDLPENWLNNYDAHYCLACQTICQECNKYFSIHYVFTYFKDNLCENCHDRLYPIKEN